MDGATATGLLRIGWAAAFEVRAAALSPAKIADIHEDPASKQAVVMVDNDQLSLAIGKKGQNVRLASKLTGWQLEIKSRGSQRERAGTSLQALPGVGPSLETRLSEAGVKTVEQVAALSLEALTAVKGIGEKTAQKLLDVARQALKTQGEVAASQPVPPTQTADEISSGGPSPEDPPSPDDTSTEAQDTPAEDAQGETGESPES